MKKKLCGLLLTFLLTACMTVSVFAAPSTVIGGIVTEILNAFGVDGKYVELIVEELEGRYQAFVELLEDKGFVADVFGNEWVDGMELVDLKEVHLAGNGTWNKWPITIEFKAAGITSDSKVGVLHYSLAKNKWEAVPSKAGEGTITATFDSLSPVAFYALTDDNGSAGGDDNGNGGEVKPVKPGKAPSTGDAMMPNVLLMALAVISLGGIIAIIFRRRKQR